MLGARDIDAFRTLLTATAAATSTVAASSPAAGAAARARVAAAAAADEPAAATDAATAAAATDAATAAAATDAATAAAATAAATAAAPDAATPDAATAAAPGRAIAEQAERAALIRSLEELKSAASAMQAALSVRLRDEQARLDEVAGVPRARRGRGAATEVALARRESPHRGSVLLGLARVLDAEMPHTRRALAEGRLSEFRALLLVQETACLTLASRTEIDEAVCADPDVVDGLGTRRLVALVRGHAARLEPAAVVARHRRAVEERSVTLRPAPDAMTYLTALLPVAQGVACLAALMRAADGARSGGDPRTKGQAMADTLVERVTGQQSADAVPVTVGLVLSDSTLLGAGHGPAHVDGYGLVPAQVAREIVAAGLDARAAWLRRLYADPSGALLATTSAARFHPDGLAALLRARDQGLCRMPYCDAPIRHLDHVVPEAWGGPTDVDNAQGLCEACNHAKQSPGWVQRTRPGERHVVETTTPAGQVVRSTAPIAPPPIHQPPTQPPPTQPPIDPAADQPPPGARTARRPGRSVAGGLHGDRSVINRSVIDDRSVIDMAFAAIVATMLEADLRGCVGP